MDWFLYDKGVSHERIKLIGRQFWGKNLKTKE